MLSLHRAVRTYSHPHLSTSIYIVNGGIKYITDTLLCRVHLSTECYFNNSDADGDDTYYISICKLCEWNYHTTVVIASPWKEDTYELYGTIYFSIDKKYHISCFLSGLP